MARSFARIDVRRPMDPDWRALTCTQQAVYEFLITSAKLTLCGSLDVKLGSWSTLSADMDTAKLVQTLGELEELLYIGWDRDTDELAIRTFVTHDKVLQNRNMGRGMWAAWASIESDTLKQWVVDNLPEEAFDPRFDPPFPAPRNRRSNHRYGLPIEPASEPPIEPPSRSHNLAGSLHPATVHDSVSSFIGDSAGFAARLAAREAKHGATMGGSS